MPPARTGEEEEHDHDDPLAAQHAASTAFTSLFLGLGAVALLVGGIGIANVMVIAVIERRNEIGLRRALGATRAHIRRQFLTEAVLLGNPEKLYVADVASNRILTVDDIKGIIRELIVLNNRRADIEQAYQTADLALVSRHLLPTPADIDFDQKQRLLFVVRESTAMRSLR